MGGDIKTSNEIIYKAKQVRKMNKDFISLDGNQLSIEEVYKVAALNVKIEICPQAMNKVKAARKIVLEMANNDVPVYGFNRGVGENKDCPIGILSFLTVSELTRRLE
jgi:histidine ammonia-lyase